jgi:hypothetical protein
MKPFALLTLFVVGAATSAAAQPKSEETTERVSLDDSKGPTKRTSFARGEWVEIATPTPAKHGQEFVSVGREAGAFRHLRLEAASGKVIVLRVKVRFTDGTTKVYSIDKRLDAKRQKSHLIDLKNDRTIDQIVVKTETYTRGSYAIYGSSSGGVVAGR